jgi:hypothetical protein
LSLVGAGFRLWGLGGWLRRGLVWCLSRPVVGVGRLPSKRFLSVGVGRQFPFPSSIDALALFQGIDEGDEFGP